METGSLLSRTGSLFTSAALFLPLCSDPYDFKRIFSNQRVTPTLQNLQSWMLVTMQKSMEEDSYSGEFTHLLAEGETDL